MAPVKAIPWRTQLLTIAWSYVAIAVFWAVSTHTRFIVEMRDPAAAKASSGMWAAGDEMLTIFIFALLAVPTYFLLRLMAQHEPLFATGSKVLLAAAITAPLCLAVLCITAFDNLTTFRDLCLLRVFRSPFFFVVIGMARFAGRKLPSKKLLNYAVLIEALTFVTFVVLLVVSAQKH